MESALDAPGPAPHAPAGRPRARLGEALVAAGVISAADLAACLAEQAAQPRDARPRLGRLVVARGLATHDAIAAALAQTLGLELAGGADVAAWAAQLVPRPVAERHVVIGTDLVDGRLVLAMADPTDVVALDDVRLATRVRAVRPVVATEAWIRDQLARAWRGADGVPTAAEEPVEPDDVEAEHAAATPVVRLVSSVLADAVRMRASDVHLQPERDGLQVRVRVDGVLRDLAVVPRHLQAAVVSRLKVLSGLDIAERRRPQDGGTRLAIEGTNVDLRVSVLPTLHGEKAVVRLLPGTADVLPLHQVGLSRRQLACLRESIAAPQGLVLITGPTGSGKTSTLYAAITELRTPERNIVTLEDPIEVQLSGITQVQTNERAGLTFAAGLRSVLRQDPDIVLVGEVRDSDTAELALRASLTGHLVLSTLHTLDAAAAITRLVDMGVEPFLIASSLSLVVAQRLARSPCPACVAPYQPDERTLQLLGLAAADIATATPRRGRGCAACGQTGYRGRTAIFEVLPVDQVLRTLLGGRASETEVRTAARAAGVASLRSDGVTKALAGLTTFEEVVRVTQVDPAGGRRCDACRGSVADDMHFCPWCASAQRRDNCECGRALERDWRACPQCGRRH